MKKILFTLLITLTMVYGYTPPKNNSDLKNYVFDNLECDRVISTPIYDSCYDYSRKGPLAVAYVIDGSYVDEINLDISGYWKTAEDIPEEYRVFNSDHYKSGYDKGHLAYDSGFDYNETILKYTYILGVNSIPQSPAINRYLWIKAERKASDIALLYGRAYVIDIVVYDTETILLNNSVHIPTKLYKIIYSSDNSYRECYKYSNVLDIIAVGDELMSHQVDCSSINLSKIKLFKLIP